MIVLHRLGHKAEEFHLNPDLIVTVEATPDTVVTLTTGTKIVVVESPVRVAEEVRRWRTDILRDALGRRRDDPLPERSALARAASSRLGERPLQAVEAPAGDRPTEKRERPADYPER